MSTEFDYLWEGGPLMKQCFHFKLGTDSVLLGSFAEAKGALQGVDLGCCTGVLSLLLLCRNPALHMTGIEIDGAASEIARSNMEINGLSGRSEILNADIRDYKNLLPAGKFDIAISNPPYFTSQSGDISPDARRAAARGEVSCTLEDIISAASYLLRWDGKFFMVHRPERLVDIFNAMRSGGIEPKRIRFVAHRCGLKPSLVLIEGRRGGKPSLIVQDMLYITDESGAETCEIKEIYHRS